MLPSVIESKSPLLVHLSLIEIYAEGDSYRKKILPGSKFILIEESTRSETSTVDSHHIKVHDSVFEIAVV